MDRTNLCAYSGGGNYLDANLMASSGSGMTAYIPRTVALHNLTNPSWGANFNVGDTFSVTVQGPGNLPNKVIVGERFTDFLGGTPPAPNGIWYAAVSNPSPGPSGTGQLISESPSGEMLDHYGLGGAAVGFIQYYYAYSFQAPSWLNLSGFSLPGLPGYLPGGTPGGVVLPLWIHDQYNGCEANLGGGFTALPAQTILLAPSFVGVDGDMGPSTNCAPIL